MKGWKSRESWGRLYSLCCICCFQVKLLEFCPLNTESLSLVLLAGFESKHMIIYLIYNTVNCKKEVSLT
jgi:hypothetical protein